MSTSIRPRTAPSSPARPQSSYSTRSTIRRVTPSPDSLSDALDKGFAAISTPKTHSLDLSRHPTFSPSDVEREIVRPRTAGSFRMPTISAGDEAEDMPEEVPAANALPTTRPIRSRTITPTRIPQPTSPAVALQRRHAGRISSTKRASPRKHRPLSTPTSLAAHAEIQDLPPALPTPQIPSPLRALPLPPFPMPPPQNEQTRAQEPFTMLPAEDPFISFNSPTKSTDPDKISPSLPLHTPRARAPSHAHRKAMNRRKQIVSPSPNPLRQVREASIATSTSNRSIFSTPGRDEMERKAAKMDESVRDEGVFGTAKGVKDLEQRRKGIVDRGRQLEEDGEDRCGCGGRCVMM